MCLKWRTQLVREWSMSNVGHDQIQPLNAWFFNVKLCKNTSETTLPPPYSLSSPPSHIIFSSKLGSSKASPIIPLPFSTRLDCYADTAFIFKESHSRHSTISFTHFQGELRPISVCQTDGRGGVWNPHTKASSSCNVWLVHPSRGCNSSVTCTNLLLHKHPFHCRWNFFALWLRRISGMLAVHVKSDASQIWSYIIATAKARQERLLKAAELQPVWQRIGFPEFWNADLLAENKNQATHLNQTQNKKNTNHTRLPGARSKIQVEPWWWCDVACFDVTKFLAGWDEVMWLVVRWRGVTCCGMSCDVIACVASCHVMQRDVMLCALMWWAVICCALQWDGMFSA